MTLRACQAALVSLSRAAPRVCACGGWARAARARAARLRARGGRGGGARAHLRSLLLRRDAERKAFAEVASLKQAENMDKIVAERKRLAQLMVAEKQHSLKILEAAMAETKASKHKSKRRERNLYQMEAAAEKATEEVDSKLKEDESNKIMEYYSKLNMEVEKTKLHTEWKIKRLQLDESRMQLLSTEERNLKREKLELEHQRNEAVMAMSIQSLDMKSDDDLDDKNDIEKIQLEENEPATVSSSCGELHMNNAEKLKAKSSDMFSAICNVAKSIFGVGKQNEDQCDNEIKVDAQGNLIISDAENNINADKYKTSNDIIGYKMDNVENRFRYLERQQDALKNKQKVMSHEFGELDIENNQLKDQIFPALDDDNNIKAEFSPFVEAKRNRLKILGTEFDMKLEQEVKNVISTEPRTDALKEAMLNKQKVLGVEYNLPCEYKTKKEPMNIAQKEAILNKKKILGSDSDFDKEPRAAKFDSSRKSNLRLDLKRCSEPSPMKNLSLTPSTGALTPGEFIPSSIQLDIETPTTGDIPIDNALTSEIFTPENENKDVESGKENKGFLSSNGFNFSLIVDEETAASDEIIDIQIESPENSPSKSVDLNTELSPNRSVFNILDGTHNLDGFDPFGVKNLQNYTKNYFDTKINADSKTSFYTHPGTIMEEVKKSPGDNIFASRFDLDSDEDEQVTCDNIATLTACLQRSVMLPLTYQLEVVNNSILNYFLIDLDMYEHLKSLRDYFFLMDGEFSRSICHNLFTKLTKTLNPQELLNFATLHNILDKALGSSIMHIHKFSENLSFNIADSPLCFQHSSPDVLQCLSLTYSVSWPLNIILSQEALTRYAKVFQFLIKMRRISWVLSEDFENLKLSVKLQRGNARKLLKSQQYISVQIYRHIMASLIRALDNYIVTTSISSSWTEFENDLKKARTLDDLYDCHVVYIKNVLFRCLLNNRSTSIMELLNNMFTVILKFSRVLKAGDWHQKEPNGYFTHTSFHQLEELFHLFKKVAKYLHKVILTLTECGYQRHLVELLTTFNLNGYYDLERSKDDPNTSI